MKMMRERKNSVLPHSVTDLIVENIFSERRREVCSTIGKQHKQQERARLEDMEGHEIEI